MKRFSLWHLFLKIFFSVVITFAAGPLSAQIPSITSFTPTSGPIGTAVTITGTNFSTTPANNVVWFGAVQAAVTAASATELIVTVPTGATYQPISVTVNGFTVYSIVSFTLTFSSTRVIDAAAFATRVDFSTGLDPQDVAFVDIDGDGKPDLVVTNANSNTISVYRNTSSSGSISAGSFEAKVNFNTYSTPFGISIGDIDCDGKPDLVIANVPSSATVSVFRNTSTPGSITAGSFAARVDLPTGNSSNDVAISDIDRDGKPDMVITNFNSSTISIYRNISTPGSISTSSFEAKVDFPSEANLQNIAIADIDGDGMPDMIVPNFYSNTVSVYRNISTTGSITTGSFDTKVDFTTGINPLGVELEDIDGDTKPDMIISNMNSNTVSVYRNISTAGSITSGSFADRVDFGTGPGPRGIALGDIDGDNKPDLVIADYSGNSVSVLRNKCTTGSIAENSFAVKVDFPTWTGPSVAAVGDIDGDGKPDITVVNSNSNVISILRNIIPPPVPPIITSFTPTSGPIGTIVTINGSNFSTTAANNIVWFGAVQATVTAATATQLTVTVPTGTTYQPITVTVNGLTAYSLNPFDVTFSSSHIIDASAFALPTDFSVGYLPAGIAIGDIDGDGKPDLAIANGGSNTISIFRNISTYGNISAGSFAAKVDLTSGGGTRDLVIGDVDGDGKPDLVVINDGSNTMSVFRNTCTSGSITIASFAARVDFITGTNPQGVAIGDIDGDGKPDLAVADYASNNVSVFRNTSTSGSITAGSFAAKVDFTTGMEPRGIAIGDFDGDGKPDLCVTNYTSNSVSIFRNTSTSGTIDASSFAAKVDFTTGAGPTGIAISDLDGDSKLDLAVTNNTITSVSVFRNTSTSGFIGPGSFATKVDFATGSYPNFLSICDIDGDRKPDIAIPNYGDNSVSVFRNTSSSGTIGASSFATRVDFNTGTGSFGTALGDIDGDGKPDLCVTNNGSSSISLLRNTLTIPVPPVITSFTPTAGPIGTTVTISGTNFSSTAANNIVWFGAVQATVTAATATQLTVTVPTGATYQPISVTTTLNGLTAYSNTPFTVTFPGSHIIDASAFALKVDFGSGTAPVSSAIADIDGDGKPDLVIANNNSSTVSVYRNTSSSGSIAASSFAARVDLITGTNPNRVTIGDIDGDGKPDLIVINQNNNSISVFRNTSTPGSITASSFATKVDFAAGSSPYYVAIGDIDGDGKPDLAVTNWAGNTVSVFRNTSTSGSITSDSFASKVDFIVGAYPSGVAVRDIDGDGKPDLVVNNVNNKTVSIFKNTSTSGYINSGSFASKVDFTTGTAPLDVAVADIDGDGKPDIVVNTPDNNMISVFRNISSLGSITESSFDSIVVDFSTEYYPFSFTIGDIDGDGKPDLVVGNNNNSVSVYKNTSISGSITSGSFAARVNFNYAGGGVSSIALCDLDGDGKPDITLTISYSNTVSVLRNKISEPVPPVITSFTPTSGPIGTTITINGSNFSTTAANNIVWFGAVKATVTTATATQLTVTVPTGATYQPISVTTTLNGLTAYSNKPFNVTFISSQVIDVAAFAAKIDFTAGTQPESTALGDIDGDGKPDLVVANFGSNTISVYRNTSISGSITAGSFATPVDLINGTNPSSITIRDIDGNGKPDLIVTNGTSNTISVYRNKSTPGSIGTSSFDTRVDFTAGWYPQNVAIGDIDGDGKPDLAITNSGTTTISILRNTSTTGSITASSFADKIDFTSGTDPRGITIRDIDGDGRPDLAVTNYASSTVSAFRNTSISGSISFAIKVDFTTETNPWGVAIGDIDGDDKPDLAITYLGAPDNVSVLKNNSAPGSISFATKIDFTTGSNPYGVAISDIDGNGKLDLLVTNSLSNTVSVLRNTGIVGSVTSSSFASRVDFTSGNYPEGVVIGDIDGDGKPDVVFTNKTSGTVSVLRNTISETVQTPPVITSFTPTSGPIGTTVTITGSNFSTTAASNVVWFGAVKATVTAATATQLTVTVPIGTTYQPISVTVNGLTAYSSKPFNVTFSSTQIIDASSFAAKVDFTDGTNPHGVAICDIDCDGKPDIVTINFNNAVSVYRNISSSGSISAGSFPSRVDFTSAASPNGLAIGDIDGDGKPDLVVSNWGMDFISVFRNTSTSGSITFAARVDFATGTFPQGVVIGDIDGDGKPDLAVMNRNSYAVSIFRNTSTPGSISTSSFAAKVDFGTGTYPSFAAIGDIDADGKPDLAVTNFGSNTISVFRNTSTLGSITTNSLAAKVDFGTGTNPYGVVIGDIDGDSKPDLAVENRGTGGMVSVLRNTSASGSISATSFAAKVDFTTGATPYSIAIGDIDWDGKPDLAVTNYDSQTVSVYRNISTYGSITTGSFATKIDFTTGSNPGCVALGDLDGDGRSDLIVTNGGSGTVSVFRNTISAPLVITSFTPTSGPIGSVVTIIGSNFSTTAANNIVHFGDILATVTASTATQLTVTVPAGATNQIISVTVNGQTAYSSNIFIVSNQGNSFEFESPVITLNGDGINDRLVIKNFDSYGECSISVFNSRGALIYSNKNYMNNWDMTINGHLLETGGYFYIAETGAGVFRGSFSILR
jgi:gliding motility-associated-like protein